eukprot:8238697-Alexandrium_andersonii.AAC.1
MEPSQNLSDPLRWPLWRPKIWYSEVPRASHPKLLYADLMLPKHALGGCRRFQALGGAFRLLQAAPDSAYTRLNTPESA